MGIVLAAGLVPLAVLGSALIGAVLLVFARQKDGEQPYILVIRCVDEEAADQARTLVEDSVRRLSLKSKQVDPEGIELNYEVRLKKADSSFIHALAKIPGVSRSALVSYNGDYMG